LLSPACDGPNCPSKPLTKGSYFVDEIGPCEQTEDAQKSANATEYCRLSPMLSAWGIEFIFNNLLDASSIELVRKRPDNPNLFEVYDWKVDILHIEGPITRYNGDYNRGGSGQPDTMTRMVNLTCAENLGPEGFSHEDYENPATNPCNTVRAGRPLKMRDGIMRSYRGRWTVGGSRLLLAPGGPEHLLHPV
jgi:hypothetical protein